MGASLFQNQEAEKAILGLILSDSTFVNLIPQLVNDDFSTAENQSIFKAMRKLQAEKHAVDLITLNDTLVKDEPLDAGRIVSIAMGYANGILLEKYHIKEYLAILKEASMRRKMLLVVEEAKKELCETSDDTTTVLEKTRQSLRDIVITKHSWIEMRDVLSATYEAIERRASGEDKGMTSGISSLDHRMAGFHKGEMTVIGARPAVGKSALGAHIAKAMAESGYKVGICSREMTTVQYGMRTLATASGVDNEAIRSGDLTEGEWLSLATAIGPLSNLPMSFVFSVRFVEDLRMEVQKKVDSNELDVLIVDYMQLMQSRQRFDGDWLRIGYISKMLKDMTIDFNIAVIALAQVNRSVENNMPTLADLRGSGDIEQDADNVIFMHRPTEAGDRYVHPDDKATFEQLKAQGLQYIALNVAKQRQGPIGTTCVIFDPSKMRYIPIERRNEN